MSKWKDQFPEKLVEYMEDGLLDCQICKKFRISRETFYEWLRTKPTFKIAYEEGLPLAEAKYLEFALKKMEEGDDKGYKYWISIMNNKFRSSGWQREAGPQGSITNIQNNISIASQKTEQELIEILMDKLSDPLLIPLLTHGSKDPKEQE